MTRRPDFLKPPVYLAKSPPIPRAAGPGDPEEHGGPKGPEPTRYGDWEKDGICKDF